MAAAGPNFPCKIVGNPPRDTRWRLENNRIRGNYQVWRMPYIKDHFRQRLANYANIQTVDQLLFHFHNMTRRQIKQEMTIMLQNPRRNQCVPYYHRNPADTPRHESYHVRDVNRCAYESVLQLLRWARAQPAGFDFNAQGFRGRPTLGAPPPNQRNPAEGARFCSCLATQADCNTPPNDGLRLANPHIAAHCRWSVAHNVCQPRGGSGFEGVVGYSGQRRSNANRQGMHYSGAWRDPGHIPMRPRPRRRRRARRR